MCPVLPKAFSKRTHATCLELRLMENFPELRWEWEEEEVVVVVPETCRDDNEKDKSSLIAEQIGNVPKRS